MSAWLVVTALFFGAFVLTGARCTVGDPGTRIVGLSMASVVATLLFLALGELLGQSTFTIVAIVTGLGGLVTNLGFVRYLTEDGQSSPQASTAHRGGVRAAGAGGPRTTTEDGP